MHQQHDDALIFGILLTFIAIVAVILIAISASRLARADTGHGHGDHVDGGEVDVQLVLAADVSLSMDDDDMIVQRRAYIEAFRSRLIADVSRHGPHGRIAVTFIEWSGMGEQRIVVPWTLIHDEASAAAVADAIEAAPMARMRRTALGDALMFASAVMDTSPWRGTRRVIDVSGDGTSNEGIDITAARDAVLARGIVINGLPLVVDRGSTRSQRGDGGDVTLEDYYRECVVGGPGHFLIPVTAIEQLPEALRTKLVIEIADLMGGPRVIPAQAEERVIEDCNAAFAF